MSIHEPLWLLLLPLVAALFWFSLPRDGGAKRHWPHGLIRWLLVARSLALACVVLALARPSLTLPSDRRDLAILIDVSDSQGAGLVEASRASSLALLSSLRPDDRASVLIFAGSAQVVAGPGSPSATARDLSAAALRMDDSAETDLRAAFSLAAAQSDPGAGAATWWLYSDGQVTAGDSLAALGEAGVPATLWAVPLGRPARQLASLSLQPPPAVRPGETAVLRWQLESPGAATINARISLDGELARQLPVTVVPGTNQVEIPVAIGNAGDHRVDIAAFDGAGREIVGGQVSALVQVAGPARVLLVRGGGGPSPLAAVLRSEGMAVSEGSGAALPADVTGYAGLSGVVLDNLHARDLAPAQLSALQAWVSAGGGLLVVGGDSSLGRGEYYATPLEELLPVQTDTRQRLFFDRTKILFVIDHSGSMSEAAGSVTKLEAAMQGVSLAVRELSDQDEVAVLSFDSEPTWVLDFTPVKQKAIIEAALGDLPTGGGTDMSRAMEEVANSFGQPGPTRRHVIFLTDGQTADVRAHFKELADQLAVVGVTITTIGIGDEINEDLLTKLADWGNGTFYHARADEVPRLIKKDTIQMSRDLIQEGLFKPQTLKTGGLLAGMPDALPAVSGYLITRAKPQATVWLAVQGKAPSNLASATTAPDPLLASWHYGNGQVAVFTADSGSRWLGAWSGQPVLNRLWTTVLHGIESGRRDEGLQLAVQSDAATARISVDALGPDQRLAGGLSLEGQTGDLVFNLSETAPGHYQATVPLGAGGLHQFRVTNRADGSWAAGWTWNPLSGETSRGGVDLAGLGRLAVASGGGLRVASDTLPVQRDLTWSLAPVGFWFLVLAIVILLIDLGLRSTMLGQLAMAAALFGEWLKRQRAQAVPTEEIPVGSGPVHEAADHDRVMDAYRYLAIRAQNRANAQAAHLAEAVKAADAANAGGDSGQTGG